ncbi:NAD-dependent epimerase/dehydratase family protein [Mycobacterium xenopi]|uniref:NAD-dependent epimerase/dehydratase family protein n=1 Tax=Mycobacterium xenopi TaxID=1789 RepID=UPI0002EAB08A|nr:NAD-dependent epimerase/dehydratase family protein [Mycobacterium xenopi]
MAELILVTGGTGTLGCVVSERLLDAGAQVRVLSRGLRSIGRAPHVVGDVRTGEGLTEAMRDVDTIVHCVDPAHTSSMLRLRPQNRIWFSFRSSVSTGYRSAITSASSPTSS